MKKANRIITILIFIFLYIPMAVLVVASFNTGKDITQFEGFTLSRYAELFRDAQLLRLLGNSLLISVLASGISTVLGTLSAVGIYRLKPKMRRVVMSLTNIPMTNPDIVTGVSLSLLFVFIGGRLLGQKESLTFWTLLIAHVTFGLPYVILNVMPKLQQMNPALQDAALDLGCTPLQAFFKVTIHEIMPGMIAGAIMAFTMSLDDFVISYFVTGSDFMTLPVEIYSLTKKPIQPKIYAMFTLLFLLIFVLMVTMNVIQVRGEQQKHRRRAISDSKAVRIIKVAAAIAAAVAILVGMAFLILPSLQPKITLNVYNWGQYMARGEDGSTDIIAAFEEKYPHIKVNYTTYDSNEIMYSKLSGGGVAIDVVFPSDYMIARMIQENMLLELNFDNIPNYQYIDESFLDTAYDPENKYSVPYTWGTVGIIYNTKYVDEADVTGWELMWNEKYAGKILMFDNSRDAFGIAQFLLGEDINTTDKAVLDATAAKLKEQKPVLQQYVMDQIYSTMENEEAWIAAYYAGDCMTMMENNEDLAFYLPENQGFNMFIDAACIPTCCKEKEAAELFINFLCEPEISAANMDWVCYSTPISAAKEYLDEETVNDPVAYPSEEILKNGVSFAYLPEEISRYTESLFMQVRNS
ncbi:MAG: extracellular solute-binding protein [Oscillospiraceae bacterium]|nr:extracellular solute-binding protein [Oscillospiraceae bacterium]